MRKKLWTSKGENGLFFNNRFFISPFFVFFTAVLCACVTVCICINSNEHILDDLILNFLHNRQTRSFIACFASCFISEIVYLLLFYVLGTSSVGVPLLYIIIYSYIFGKASVLSFLYLEYGLTCFFKSLFLVIPVYTFLCFVMTHAFTKAKELSKYLFERDFLRKQNFHNLNMKKYSFSYLIYLIAVLILSIYDAVISRFTGFLIS